MIEIFEFLLEFLLHYLEKAVERSTCLYCLKDELLFKVIHYLVLEIVIQDMNQIGRAGGKISGTPNLE